MSLANCKVTETNPLSGEDAKWVKLVKYDLDGAFQDEDEVDEMGLTSFAWIGLFTPTPTELRETGSPLSVALDLSVSTTMELELSP